MVWVRLVPPIVPMLDPGDEAASIPLGAENAIRATAASGRVRRDRRILAITEGCDRNAGQRQGHGSARRTDGDRLASARRELGIASASDRQRVLAFPTRR